jgi:hypothetical protein
LRNPDFPAFAPARSRILANKAQRDRLIPLGQENLTLPIRRRVGGKGGDRVQDTSRRRCRGIALPTNTSHATAADQRDKNEQRHTYASAEAPIIGPAKHQTFSHFRLAKR